jgi:hypothetical protein
MTPPRPKNSLFADSLTVQSNKAGSQHICVKDLENNPRVQKTVERLYDGFVSEQRCRSISREGEPKAVEEAIPEMKAATTSQPTVYVKRSPEQQTEQPPKTRRVNENE